MTLSETQTKILNAALLHADDLATPPSIPAGARQKVAQALLGAGLVERVERADHDAADLWTVSGETLLLALTAAGRAAVAAPDVPREAYAQHAIQPAFEPAQASPRPLRMGLRDAAAAVLVAWDAPERETLDDAMTALRDAIAGQTVRQRNPGAPRKSREGTKQEAVLILLRRPEGATIANVMEATAWQQHTVRGFLAGLKKRKGVEVTVLERVRQVGPNKTGAKGSYSIYQIKAAG